MSNIILKFANDVQYQQFVDKVKAELLEEMRGEQKRVQPRNWWLPFNQELRSEIQRRYNENVPSKLPSHLAWYDIYKCIFNIHGSQNIMSAMDSESEELTREFTKEFIDLIDKYRELNTDKKE